MRRHARGTDKNAATPRLRVGDILLRRRRGPVRGRHPDFKFHTELAQHRGGRLHDRPIRFGTHKYRDPSHNTSSFSRRANIPKRSLLDNSGQLERDQCRGQLAGLQPGQHGKLIEADGVALHMLYNAPPHRVRVDIERRFGRARRPLFQASALQHILGAANESCALLDEPMTSATDSTGHRARHGQHVTTLLGGQTCSYQRTTFVRGFHDHRGDADPADDSVAFRELARPGRDLIRILADQQPSCGHHLPRHGGMFFWIKLPQSAAEHRRGAARTRGRQCALVRGPIDPQR